MAYALTRTTLGRLGAHSSAPITDVSTAFSAGDWDPATGLTVSVLGSSQLRFAGAAAASRRFNRYSALADRADAYVQCRWASKLTGGAGGPLVRLSNEANPDDGVGLFVPSGFSGSEGLYEYDGGVAIQSSATGSRDRTLPEVLFAYAVGTVAKSYNVDSNEERTLTGLTIASGAAGLYYSSGGAANNIDYSSFYVMRSHLLVVNGPTTGTWRARVLNALGIEIVGADQSGGVATIDLFAARIVMPEAYQIDIYDTVAATQLVVAAPVERVWPGDVWSFDETPATPSAPTVGGATGSSLDVSWTAVTGADTYILERSLTGVGGWSTRYTGSALSFGDTGLSGATTYYYRVTAQNEAGDSAPSANGSGTTTGPTPPPATPLAPTVDGATASTLNVSWASVATATGYTVERLWSGAPTWEEVYTGAGLSFTDTGLNPGTVYAYRVQASNAGGDSAFGPDASGTTSGVPLALGQARTYRLRVRDASTQANPNGTTDVLSLTSLRL